MARFGPRRQAVRSSAEVAAIPIGAHTAVIYSKSFDLSKGTNFAVEFLAAGTTVNLIIEMEQGSVLPTTEGAADTTNYSVPSGSTAIIDGLTQKTHFCKSYSPVTLRYGRFKISTKTGNTADVTLNAWLSKLEDD